MKVAFTGGASGGHFYPIIAVAEALSSLAFDENYVKPKMFYFGPTEYDKKLLFDNDIAFRRVIAGKQRVGYGRIQNFLGLFVTLWGVMQALWYLYRIFPDVIFSKGSFTSIPVLIAAKIFGIPIVVHESDSRPGRANVWAGKFATKVAVSYPEAAEFFDMDSVAVTGNPIRKELLELPTEEEGCSFFELEKDIPTILVLGGSQGAEKINEAMLGILARTVEKYNVIHQTGNLSYEEINRTKDVILEGSTHKERYKPLPFLDVEKTKYAAAAADLVITRAGSSLFEVAEWKIPSIVIPINISNADHQRANAYAYTHDGAGVVIEEANLTSNIILSQIHSLFTNESIRKQMGEAAHNFARSGAAKKIAHALFDIGMKHEQ
ncbi:MAG: UDP-N-acetylglucosamine--N-acetylmuramyl-(pentapeptide) pyrophosphoryl-undecaprenol N-acetylglucosamine transferase [Candidatus Paceibacterota bacterium]